MISTAYDPEADGFFVRPAAKGTAVTDTQDIEPHVLPGRGIDGKRIGSETLCVQARARPRIAFGGGIDCDTADCCRADG